MQVDQLEAADVQRFGALAEDADLQRHAGLSRKLPRSKAPAAHRGRSPPRRVFAAVHTFHLLLEKAPQHHSPIASGSQSLVQVLAIWPDLRQEAVDERPRRGRRLAPLRNQYSVREFDFRPPWTHLEAMCQKR